MYDPKFADIKMRLFLIELTLAQQTAFDVYFSNDPHVVWHCFQPFLSGRSVLAINDAVLNLLIPLCQERPRWQHLIPRLQEISTRIVCDLSPTPRAGCPLC